MVAATVKDENDGVICRLEFCKKSSTKAIAGKPLSLSKIYTRKRCTDYIMEVKRELTFMRDAAKEWREMQFNSNEYKKPTSLRGISGNQVR